MFQVIAKEGHPRASPSCRRGALPGFDQDNLISSGGLGAGARLGRPLRPARPGWRACPPTRFGRGLRGGEGDRAGRGHGRRRGLHRGHGSVASRRDGRVFVDVRAPSAYRTFLRSFTFGHVRQLDAVAARFLPRLAAVTPLLPGVGEVAYLDLDDSVRRTYGYAKQGAGFGYSGVKGLNFLLATLSSPLAAPVIAATTLREDRPTPPAGQRSCWPIPLASPQRAGGADGQGLVIARADSAYYNHDIVASARRAGAQLLPHRPANSSVTTAIAAIGKDAWTAIRYPEGCDVQR